MLEISGSQAYKKQKTLLFLKMTMPKNKKKKTKPIIYLLLAYESLGILFILQVKKLDILKYSGISECSLKMALENPLNFYS